MSERSIQINRAPVLTLWTSTVAERLGFNQDEALSLGKSGAAEDVRRDYRSLGFRAEVWKLAREFERVLPSDGI